MDLNDAIARHAEWKLKFRTAISRHETMDAATIGRDDCCELGKWLHGEGKSRWSSLPAYSDCVARHAGFHSEAGKVAVAINNKRYAEAEAMLGSGTPYAAASNDVGSAVISLKRQARL